MNETISKWLGECRHMKVGGRFGLTVTFLVCEECGETVSFKQWKQLLPNYENDPAAWTPELFDRIEAAGLRDKFVDQFIFITGETEDRLMSDFLFMWLSLKATPAQKAAALSRAIKEVA